ncbi:helix-turn-helix transcriptional regulator [Cupriavidus necator]
MTNKRRGGGARLFGTGRIVFWRGGSIWIGHAEEETGFYAHTPSRLRAIQWNGAFADSRRRLGSLCSGISAHHPHAFEARGELVALIFTGPESREGPMLRERFRTGIASLALDTFADQAAAIATAYDANATDEELSARAVIARLTLAQALPSKQLDKRIERAIEVLRERVGEAVTLTEIADPVHLSPKRFRHLFLKETGIRFRPYELWLRLELVIASYAAGNNLTEASHAGGFADSAHFSRTFKRMFGVRPAASASSASRHNLAVSFNLPVISGRTLASRFQQKGPSP